MAMGKEVMVMAGGSFHGGFQCRTMTWFSAVIYDQYSWQASAILAALITCYSKRF